MRIDILKAWEEFWKKQHLPDEAFIAPGYIGAEVIAEFCEQHIAALEADKAQAEMVIEGQRRELKALYAEAQAAHARGDALLAEIREIIGVGHKPMLADLPDVVRTELARLRRVVVAYIAWETLGQQAKAEWASAEETPRECLEWVAEINKAKAELDAALLDSGVSIPEEVRRDLESEKEEA